MAIASKLHGTLLVALLIGAGAGRAAAETTQCIYQKWLLGMVYQTETMMDDIAETGRLGDARPLAQSLERVGASDLVRAMEAEGYAPYRRVIETHVASARAILAVPRQTESAAYERHAQMLRLRGTSSRLLQAISKVDCTSQAVAGEVPNEGRGANPKRAASSVGASQEADFGSSQDNAENASASSGDNRAPRSDAEHNAWLSLKLVPGMAYLLVPALLILVALKLLDRRIRYKKRRLRRYVCDIPCTLTIDGDMRASRVLDISELGAKLQVKLDGKDRPRLAIETLTFSAAGRVAWSNAHYCGVTFDSPLQTWQIDAALHAAAPAA